MIDDTLASNPFSYQTSKDGVVRIFRSSRLALTLKGKKAQKILAKLNSTEGRESQIIMAKVTGQFKFGNEGRQKKLK